MALWYSKAFTLNKGKFMDYNKAQAQEKAQMLKDMWNELTGYEEDSFTPKLFESIDRLTNEALPQDEAEQIAQMLKNNLNLNDDIDYLFNYNQKELSQNNEQENLNTNSQEQTNENTQENAKNYSNLEKRQILEKSLNEYDELCKNNKDFNNLHLNRQLDENLTQQMQENEKNIIEKENEIKQKQERLDELARQNNKETKFNGEKINKDEDDPLAKEKQELQNLKEKSMSLKEQKKKCEQDISESVAKIASSDDVYETYKALINIYRRMKEAQGISDNLKFNKERMKELDEKIKNYNKKLENAFKIAGLTKEGKELLYELNKDLYQTQKESIKELENLRLQKQFNDDLNILFKQRTSTTNLDNNTKDIEKLVQKIQKQAPNFEKNYATSFKEAMGIINEKGKTNENTQFQNRSA